MEFGKIDQNILENVVFELPEIQAENLFFEHKNLSTSQNPPQILVGCPIWANKNWVNHWYPAQAKEKDFLGYYAQQFNTIELNSTHYQIPNTETIKNWAKKVPAHFHFCPKFPQEISHKLIFENSLKTQELTHLFCENMRFFGENLGTSFLQLPPYFSPKDIHLLLTFCENIKKLAFDFNFSVEFRHEDWFLGDNLTQVAQKLADYHIGTVITDTAGRRDAVHCHLANEVLMLRFVGNDLHKSDFERVNAWISHISMLLAGEKQISKLYFFAHEPNNDFSPELALYFIQNLTQKIPFLNIKAPKKIEKQSLF